MAWTELAKFKRGKVWQDGSKRALTSFCGTKIHYESTLDSGNYDTPVNMAPVRVQNAQLDGWRVTQNGWHYAIGIEHINHPGEDGWVGFGGRKGQHWFKFRLERMLYVHWPTRTWETIGGLANYSRTFNLTQGTTQRDIGFGENLNLGSFGRWRNLWTTSGGGEVELRWNISGSRLKQFIYLNQAGRTWITNNAAPSTPLNETYFGFVFRLDYTDIPKRYLGQVLSSIDDDIEDSDKVFFKTALDELLFFMPLDDLWVEDANGNEIEGSRLQLKKRLYKDGSNYYLVVGQRVDILNNLPSGTLVFDPTLDDDVSASDHDANEADDGSAFSSTNTNVIISSNSTASSRVNGAFYFEMPSGPDSGDTIDACSITIVVNSSGFDDPNLDMHFEDVDSAVDFGDNADVTSRTRTSNSVPWVDTGLETIEESPSIVGPLQEVVNRAGYASGNPVVALWDGKSSGSSIFVLTAYDDEPAEAASLHVEWTAASSETEIMSDNIIAFSNLLNLTADRILNVSYRGNLNADSILNYDNTALLNLDHIIPLSYNLELVSDSILNFESQLILNLDHVLNHSSLLDLDKNSVLNLSNNLDVLPDNIIVPEWLGVQIIESDHILNIEHWSNLDIDSILNIGHNLEIENNFIKPISFLEDVKTDQILNAEYSSLLNLDSILNLSHNLEIVNDFLTNLSNLASLVNLYQIPISSRLILFLDHEKNIEHTLKVNMSAIIPISWIEQGTTPIFVDKIFHLEWDKEYNQYWHFDGANNKWKPIYVG